MLLRTLLAFGFNAFLLAQTWPLASPGDWKVRPEWAGAPAVVLEDRTTFRRGNIDRYRKVLIFTEAGRLVAQPDIPAEGVTSIQARVQTPAGGQFPLKWGERIRAIPDGIGIGIREFHLQLPPMEGPWMLEVGWREEFDDTDRPMSSDLGDYHKIVVGGKLPIAHAVVAMDSDAVEYRWRQWIDTAPGTSWSRASEKGQALVEFRDIPPMDESPFGNDEEARLPIFHWYRLPDLSLRAIGAGVPVGRSLEYLDLAAMTIFHTQLTQGLYLGPKNYPRVPKQLLEVVSISALDMPSEDILVEALKRLRRRVRVIHNRADAPDPKAWDSMSMLSALKRGWASPFQMNLLGFATLANYHANLSAVFVQNRFKRRFSESSNLYQFDGMILRYQDSGGIEQFVDLAALGDPFHCPPPYQGTRAVSVQVGSTPLETTAKVVDLPISAASDSTQTWELRFEHDPRGAYQVQFHSEGPIPIPPGILKRLPQGQRLEFPMREGFRFSELLPGRMRTAGLTPFGSIELPFDIPTSFPPGRRIGIELPVTCRVTASARIPWRRESSSPEAWNKSNHFGEVGLEIDRSEDGSLLTLKLRIQIKTLSAPPERAAELEQFMGWIRAAMDLHLDSGVNP